MRTINRVERILKDLDALSKDVETAAKCNSVLETKVNRFRIVKMLKKCRADIRLRYYDIDDCESGKANY